MWATILLFSRPVMAIGGMFAVCWIGLSVEVTRADGPRGGLGGVRAGDSDTGTDASDPRHGRVSSFRRGWPGHGQRLRRDVGELGQQAYCSVDVGGRGSVHGVRVQDLGEGVERVERGSRGRGHAAQT